MTTRSWAPPVVLISSVAAMLEGVAANGPSPVRTAVVVWFLVVCPGLAIIALLRLRDAWLEVALVPALSLAIDILVSGTLAYAGLWSPAACILVLVSISVGGALAQDGWAPHPQEGTRPS
jgi:hypothetical membrane protein